MERFNSVAIFCSNRSNSTTLIESGSFDCESFGRRQEANSTTGNPNHRVSRRVHPRPINIDDAVKVKRRRATYPLFRSEKPSDNCAFFSGKFTRTERGSRVKRFRGREINICSTALKLLFFKTWCDRFFVGRNWILVASADFHSVCFWSSVKVING